MFRVYDLSINQEVVEQLLNDPYVSLISLNVACSESGYTTVSVRYTRVKEKLERKRRRKLERLIIFDGSNPRLDELLEDPSISVINKNDFFSENGVIIVLDYEF
jgi:hypothetical protein